MQTLSVSLDHARLLLGLRGQHLGLVKRATLDAESGELINLVLETWWQQIDISWQQVEFDEKEDAFKMLVSQH